MKNQNRLSAPPCQSQGGRRELESRSEKTQKVREGSCYALIKFKKVEEADSEGQKRDGNLSKKQTCCEGT